MPMWLQVAIGVVSGMAAMSVVWWRIVVPLARLSDATPVLVEIAAQFKPNDGHSLHDRVVRIERTGDHLEERIGRIEQAVSDIQRTLEAVIVDRRGWPPDDIGGVPI